MDRRYDPHAIEAEVAAPLEGARRLPHAGRRRDKPKFYCLDFFPYPSGDGLSVGHCRNYVPTDAVSRFKRMRASTCCTRWAGTPSACRPRTTPSRWACTRASPPSATSPTTSARWTSSASPSTGRARSTQLRPRLLPLDAVVLPAAVRARAGLSRARASSGGARAARRSSPTSRSSRAAAGAAAATSPRRTSSSGSSASPTTPSACSTTWRPSTGPSRSSSCRPTGSGAARAPRSTSRCRAATTPSRSSRRGPTRSSAPPTWCWRRSTRWSTSSPTPEQRAAVTAYQDAGAARERDRAPLAPRRRRPASSSARYAVNPVNDAADPDLDQRLRAHGLRHRRHHGRAGARRARLPVRHQVRLPIVEVIAPPERGAGRRCAEAYTGDGVMVNSGAVRRHGRRRARPSRPSSPGWASAASRAQEGQLQAARLAHQPPALLGRADPDRPLRRRAAPCRCRSSSCRCCCPTSRTSSPTDDGRRRWPATPSSCTPLPALRRPGAARDRHHGHLRLLELVPLPLRLAARRRRRPSTATTVEYWLPVDLYVGGAEHAVMHLLYARFFCKVRAGRRLRRASASPTRSLRNQGMIQAEDGQKMSKSKGNVVTPDSVVEQLRRRRLRVYELFIAPFEQSVAWSDRGVQGCLRFLSRFWNLVAEVRGGAGRAGWRRTRPRPRRAARCCARCTRRSAR